MFFKKKRKPKAFVKGYKPLRSSLTGYICKRSCSFLKKRGNPKHLLKAINPFIEIAALKKNTSANAHVRFRLRMARYKIYLHGLLTKRLNFLNSIK